MSFLERFRALTWFLGAAAWFLFSDLLARRAAEGLSNSDPQEPLYRLFLLFLLILGFWTMRRLGQPSAAASQALGLPTRPGWQREFALGAVVGWSAVVAVVLPVALIGGLVVTAFTNAHQFYVLILDLVALAAGTLAVEVTFRGYAFQRLTDALGPAMATFFMAVIYAIWRTHSGQSSTASVLVSFFLGWTLCLAALRTRAVWVSWGLHFAWVAAMGMLFGLPVTGSMSYSPVLATTAAGPSWVTGGFEGPEGGAFAVLVSFLLLFVVATATGELKHRYGHPEVVPGGIPVDLDGAARRQHEAAIGSPASAQAPLVQILPAQPGAAAPEAPLGATLAGAAGASAGGDAECLQRTEPGAEEISGSGTGFPC